MWWPNSVALALMSLLFCMWMWIVQMPHIDTPEIITTNVEVSVVGHLSRINTSDKNAILRGSGYEVRQIRKNKHMSVPRVMLDLYEKATAARQDDPGGNGRRLPDVVKSLTPRSTASMLEPDLSITKSEGDQRHLLVFDVPSSNSGEMLLSAELRLLLTMIPQQLIGQTSETELGIESLVHVYLLERQSRQLELDMQHVFQRQSYSWLSFNVTAAMKHLKLRNILRLLVLIRATNPGNRPDITLATHLEGQPLLLLSYSTPHTEMITTKSREKRDAEDYEEESNNIWDDDRIPAGPSPQARRARRQRNTCRRKPLYVDFSEIHYDTWIVAPNGYEAFQCTGKCFFPVSEHLSPTKHAIVQTLLHSVAPGKVPRACCVPTRLEPISVLYVDQRGVLTYRFSYQDMVVAECGCR